MAVINKVQLQKCFVSDFTCFSLLLVHHSQHLAGWDLLVYCLSTTYLHAKAKSGDKSPKEQEVGIMNLMAAHFKDQAYADHAP